MRRTGAIVLMLVSATGCDRVFGLGGSGDESADASTGDPRCPNPNVVAPLVITGDATLDGSVPHGMDGALHLSATTKVLVRIKRPSDLDRILLHFSVLPQSNQCFAIGGPTTCANCDAPDFGPIQISLVNSDWDEATVTTELRRAGTPWTADDKIALEGTFAFGEPGALRLEGLHLDALASPLVGDVVTFEIASSSATSAWLVSRDGDPCATSLPSPAATGSCHSIAMCGNGMKELDEQCDLGPSNGTMSSSCSRACTAGSCGNGITEPDEDCDDGNFTDGDGCDSNCTRTGCGNGIATNGEACDDGNTIDGDGCESNCTVPFCGNGIMDVGEECDDGNHLPRDGCDSTCNIDGWGGGPGFPP